MSVGIVFDIQEFCVHDGPGARTVVFLKGCPLRCKWCHNPEGLSPYPQLIRGAGCKKCGCCADSEKDLKAGDLGKAKSACPNHCLRIAGTRYTAEELSHELLKQKESLSILQGGVTLSGGECLMQSEFSAELLQRLEGIHRAIETSGHASERDFCSVIAHTDLVLFDLKHMDGEVHRRYTGVGTELIRRNLSILIESHKPFIARIPLIPGVNDGRDNLLATAQRLKGAKNLVRVELLPYNGNAGAKYAMLNETYDPGFKTNRKPNLEHLSVFAQYGIEGVVV